MKKLLSKIFQKSKWTYQFIPHGLAAMLGPKPMAQALTSQQNYTSQVKGMFIFISPLTLSTK